MVEDYEEAIRRFFPGFNVKMPKDLDPSSPEALRGGAVESLFTSTVTQLKAHSRPIIATLGQRIWDVVHYRAVHTAMTTAVNTPTFMSVRRKETGEPIGVILLPDDWVGLILKDHIMQLGAVVFAGSQAVDYFNGRLNIDSKGRVGDRAMSYEAELLKTFDPSTLNAYQLDVLAKFPNGFDPKYDYVHREVASNMA